jgi:predicted GNAT family N-acyltransferase
MTFREIEFGSGDYQLECGLRDEVLRRPLGLNLNDEHLDAESQQLHYGLFGDGGELIGCVIAVPQAAAAAKLRQMAVRPEQQGKGHGRRLIHEIELHLARQGCLHLVLHARLTAVGFYAKSGYARVGPEFTEVGIPHVRMEKAVGHLIDIAPKVSMSGWKARQASGINEVRGFHSYG